jgi:nitronate monooxygenase
LALDPDIRRRLKLPAVCAPMTAVSGPDLIVESCKAGVMAGLPSQNAGTREAFEVWLKDITERLARWRDETGAEPAPFAVNLSSNKPPEEKLADLKLCARYGVKIIITAMGDPTEMAKFVHDEGAVLYHDVTTLAHAEKAIRAKVDGLTCIGSGGGGHSGTVNHLALIPRIRQMFDGVIIMAGAVTTGAHIRAAEILGADLAYLGTRFIATQESLAPDEYKALLVSEGAKDLIYTRDITGVPANWLMESLRRKGLDPAALPKAAGHGRYDHLPREARPWRTIFSAGQGIELIDDTPSVAELVRRLRAEYVAACEIPDMAAAARLADAAAETPVRA